MAAALHKGTQGLDMGVKAHQEAAKRNVEGS